MMIGRWAGFLVRRARATIAVGVLAVIAAAAYGLVIGGGVFGHLGNGGFDDPASQSARELAREKALFGNKNADLVVLYRSQDHAVSDPAFKQEVDAALARIPSGTTTSVVTYWNSRDKSLVSTDQHATEVLISLAGKDQAATSDIADKVVPKLKSSTLRTDIAGQWAVYKGVNETVSKDLARAELISMPLVIILSLLIFGSVVAALMPAMVGGIAVIGGLAIVRLLTTFTEVSVFSLNVISLLGMGLAIDYALFVISRYREELAALPDEPGAPAQAIRTTLDTAGRTVLFSALTVAAAMSSLLIFPQNFLRSLGYGGVAAVLVAAIAALTILPGVLLLLGRRIDAGRMPWRRGRPVGVDSDHGAWARLAHGVMRRPVVVMVVIVGALLVIASPFLGVKWGSVDYRVLPPSSPAHVASVRINQEFGGEKAMANVLLSKASALAATHVQTKLRAVDGVRGVRPIAHTDNYRDVLFQVVWDGNSQTVKSQDMVKKLRAAVAPDGQKSAVAPGEVLIGGTSADTVDLGSSIMRHLPWMALIIIAVMLVLLFLAFGSIVLPVKAVIMNLLSISASFGVITWIFADGHLQGLLDYSSTGFLDMTQPIFMLAILVGLSMDYEVFLPSRVREKWDKDAAAGMSPSERNTHAVAMGVQKTGRIITSAAVLLAVVIGAFSMSGVVFMKMIGVGMLVALLVDATVVRALLVPATMRLLGGWNWYAPAPLKRFWERYGIKES